SGYFMSVNRNKESMSLNLKTEQGKEIFCELVKKSDVLVENFRPGTMEKIGFYFQELKKMNPRLVYTSVSGYGHTGPYRHKPAYDIIVQALGGIMSITGEHKGGPVKIGASMGDITAGLFAAIGTLAALSHVDKGGEGQHVDISMLDSQVAILENAISRYFLNGEIPGPIGNRHPSITPFCSLPSADGNLVIAVGNDAMWKKFCILLNRLDLLDNNKFKTNTERTTYWEELQEILEPIFQERSTTDWLELLEEGRNSLRSHSVY
ncbi:MAG TPA: carnitine dehydratase, partial [Paenibacillaceae bacterium]|nr:carnitine dehydratase [Paenibacillaceae bacterium]